MGPTEVDVGIYTIYSMNTIKTTVSENMFVAFSKHRRSKSKVNIPYTCCLFSPLLVEIIRFDLCKILQMGG